MSQVRSDAIMSRFLGFPVTDRKAKRFTLRGSRLVLASAALDLTFAGDEAVQLFAQTPMQPDPILLATLSKEQPQVALRCRFFEEDESVTILTSSKTPIHVTGEVHLDRTLQDEIEDDEEEAARMRAELGASAMESDQADEEEDDDDDDDEEEEDEETEKPQQWYRERLPEDSDGALPSSEVADDDDESDDDESDDEDKTEMDGAAAAAWTRAFADLLAFTDKEGASDDEEEEEEATASEAQTKASKKRQREHETEKERDEALLARRKAASRAKTASAAPRLKETKMQRRARLQKEAVAEAAKVAVAERARLAEQAAEAASKGSAKAGAGGSKTKVSKTAAAAAKASRPRELVLPGGVRAIDEFQGMGHLPKPGRRVTVKYVGKLANGEKFDSSNSFTFRLGVGEVVPGFDVAVKSMRVGGRRRVIIPPSAGYGSKRAGPIPPNSQLIFELQLIRAM